MLRNLYEQGYLEAPSKINLIRTQLFVGPPKELVSALTPEQASRLLVVDLPMPVLYFPPFGAAQSSP